MRNLTNLWSSARFASRAAGVLMFTLLASSLAAIAASSTPTPTYSLTASNMLQQMSPGINLGNTLEAIDSKIKPPATASQESSWGNPFREPGYL